MIKKLLFFVMCWGSTFASGLLEKTEKFLPGMQEPLPFLVSLALPDDFVAKSLIPGVTPNLFDGVIWGEKGDVNRFLSQSEIVGKLKRSYPKGNIILIADYSPNVVLVGPDRFLGEENLDEMGPQLGFCNIVKRKFRWGPYPVLSLQMTDRSGEPSCIAWIGLNHGRMVLVISAIFSEDPSTYKKGLQIWQRLMNETQYIGKQDGGELVNEN